MEKVGKKGKKKQAKDELDRTKQAEKKTRLLEKALATSAAIRSELEKKNQKKKEEQQCLDKGGTAIADTIALQAKDELDGQKQAEKKRRLLEKALAVSAAIRSELEKKKHEKVEEQHHLDKERAAIDELDRQKQTEKKRRLLEKALATSAAIRSELEKKKQKKIEELDRQKQAEKNSRLLEKALATSAAIQSELEKKKKQKKIEERRRLDKGDATAGAIALQVLSSEYTEECHHIVPRNDRIYDPWDRSSNLGRFTGYQSSPFYEIASKWGRFTGSSNFFHQ